MKRQIKLRGRLIFTSALVIIGLTVLSVYLSGIDSHRSVSGNLLISLAFIATVLFVFLTYALYRGMRIVNDYPKFEPFEVGWSVGYKIPEFNLEGDGLTGMLASVLLWIAMTILVILALLFFEALFWLMLFVLFAMLYWIFFRAIRLVLRESPRTKGDLFKSASTALLYTALYTGWMFGIAFAVEQLG